MIIRENGKIVETTNPRNDLHNTLSPKHHKPSYRPGYKQKYINQMKTNKGLLLALGLVLLLFLGVLVGSDMRVKSHQTKINQLTKELERSAEIGKTMVDEYNLLLVEYASCSAKAQEKKLSSKAKAHVKQQPLVAEKIKQVFGTEWAEATELYSRESSLNPLAINPNGGACGLWQAYPCSKLTIRCALSDVDCQLKTGKEYIKNRYGSVSIALAHHDNKGWY